MKVFLTELVRYAALLYLLGAPWAIVSSRVEGLAVVLLLAGILPAGSFLLGILKRQLELDDADQAPTETVRPETPEPPSTPQLRLVSGGLASGADARR